MQRDALTQLVERCLEGDQYAWRDLVDMITPVVMSTCRSMNVPKDESLDIFGQVCYVLLDSLENLRSPQKLLSYVGTMTRREVFSLHRQRQLQNRAAEEESSRRSELVEPEVSRRMDESDRSSKLIEAMLRLNDKEYELLWLLFFDPAEPSYDEISARLDMPISSIGPSRARALSKLQRILKTRDFKI